MIKGYNKIISIIIIFLFLMQSLPINILAAAVSNIEFSNNSKDDKISPTISMENLKGEYQKKKAEFDLSNLEVYNSIGYEADKSVMNVKAEVSAAEKMLVITGKSVLDAEDVQVSAIVKSLEGDVVFSTKVKCVSNRDFMIKIPTKNIKLSEYKVLIKSFIKETEVVEDIQDDVTSTTNAVYGSSSSNESKNLKSIKAPKRKMRSVFPVDSFEITPTPAFSPTVSNGEKILSFLTTSTDAYAATSTSSSVTVDYAAFQDVYGVPLQIEQLTPGVLRFGIKMYSTTATNGTIYLRLYNKAGDFIQETSTAISISAQSPTSPVVASIDLPPIDLTDYFVTSEVVASGAIVSDIYRAPLKKIQNLGGNITFLVGSSQTQGDKVILAWDPAPEADSYNIYRGNDLYKPNIQNNLYTGEYDGTDQPLVDPGQEYSFTVSAVSGDNVSIQSEPLKMAKGTVDLTQSISTNCVFEKANINSSISLAGKTLKVCGGDLNVTSNSTLTLGAGKILIPNGKMVVKDQASINMTNSDDYILVNGDFEMQTTVPHTGTLLNKGTIEVKGGFKVLGANFLPDGDHNVYLSGTTPKTTFDVTTKTQRLYNILTLSVPFGEAVKNFNSKRSPTPPEVHSDWCNILKYQGNSDFYDGISGVYPATGNFSRTYTDITEEAPGYDINIARTYNSSNTFSTPRRGWTLGKGWSFSYEGSVENEEADITGTPTPTPYLSTTPYPKYKRVQIPGGQVMRFSYDNENGPYTAEDSRAKLTKSASTEYTLTMKDTSSYVFTIKGTVGWLSKITDQYGNSTTIVTDDLGKVTKIKDATGKTFFVNYNSYNNIMSVDERVSDSTSSELIRRIKYSYDDGGRLSSLIDPYLNQPLRYSYNSSDYLIEVRDGYKQRIESIAYRDNGKISQITDAFGKKTVYDYGASKTTVKEYDLEGASRDTVYDYDDNQAISTVTYPDNTTSSTTYEKYGGTYNKYNDIKSVTDNYGNKTTYERDQDNGNVTAIINPDGSKKMYEYYKEISAPTPSPLAEGKRNLLKWETDEEGNYTYYEYNDTNCARQLTSKNVFRQKLSIPSSTPTGTVTPFPVPSTTNDTRFITTKYTYYNNQNSYVNGLLKSVTQYCNDGNDEAITNYSYNAEGLLYTVTDGENKITSYDEYTKTRKPKKISKPYATTNATVNYTVIENSYDLNDKLEKSDQYSSDVSTVKNTTRYIYDKNGRLIQKITPNLYNSSLDYLSSRYYSDNCAGYRYSYFSSTNKLSTMTDAEGNTTKYHKYDAFGNLLVEQKPPFNPQDSSKLESTVYRYTYDNMGRPSETYYAKDYNTNTDGSVTINSEDILEWNEYTTPPELVSTNNYLSIKKQTKYLNDTDTATTIIKSDYADRVCKTIFEQGNSEDELINENIYYKNGKIYKSVDARGFPTYYFYGYSDETNALGKSVVHIFSPFRVDEEGLLIAFSYKRLIYDDSGNLLSENTKINSLGSLNGYPVNVSTVLSEAITDTKYYSAVNTYYKNNKVNESIDATFGKKQFFYDDAGLLNRQIDYISTTKSMTTDYVNNFMGKIKSKKVSFRIGDLAGQNYDSIGDTTIEYTYEYDKNGNNTLILRPSSYSGYAYFYDKNDKLYSYGTLYNGGSYLITNTLNWAGSPITSTDRNMNTTYTKYNWQGLVSESKINAKVWSNDTRNDTAQECKTQYGYDRAGRRVTEVYPKNVVSENVEDSPYKIKYVYYKNGKLKYKKLEQTSITRLLKAYLYDNAGNMTKETTGEGDSDSSYVSYKYTPDGKIERTGDSVSVQKQLGFLNRYVYDTLGRTMYEYVVESLGTSTILYKYEYSKVLSGTSVDRMKVTKSLTSGSPSATVILENKEYDLLGNLVLEENYRDSANSNKIEYTYNNFNKLSKKIVYYNNIKDTYFTTPIPSAAPTSASTPTVIATPTPVFESKSSITKYQYDTLGNLKVVRSCMDTDTATADDIVEEYNYNILDYNTQYYKHKNDGTESQTINKGYDNNGNLTSQSDGRNNYTYYTYDELNRQKSSSITVGGKVHETQNGYDKNGNLIRKADVVANTTFNEYMYNYDLLNRLESTKDYANDVVIEKIEYNNRSLQSKSSKVYELLSPTPSITYVDTTYVYDDNGRLKDTTEDPTGEARKVSLEYDNHGNISARTDAKNQKTTYTYDNFDRLISVTNPKLETVSYKYDYVGNMTEQSKTYWNVDNKSSTSLDPLDKVTRTNKFEYNSLNKVVRKLDNNCIYGNTYLENRYEAYSYNPDGSLKYKKDRNRVITQYTYFGQGWLKEQKTLFGAQNVTISYTYDNSGNPLTVIMDSPTVSSNKEIIRRTYDESSRVTKKEFLLDLTTNAPYFTMNYAYDIITADGLLAEKATTTKGTSTYITTKKYDKVGRLKSVADGDENAAGTTYDYYKDGSRKKVTYSTSPVVTEEYTYLKGNLLNTLVNTNGTSIGSYSYTYDKNKNQVSKTETISGTAKTTNYYYDELNRLKKVKEPDTRTTLYTYDSEGNRKTEVRYNLTSGALDYYKNYKTEDRNRVENITSHTVSLKNNLTPTPSKTIELNKVNYEKGLKVSETSTNTYTVTTSDKYFAADIGLDDATETDTSKVIFKVIANGTQELYNSGEMTRNSATKSILIDISGKTSITLQTVVSGTATNCSVLWGDAKIIQNASSTNTYQYDANGNLLSELRGNYTYANEYDALNQLTKTTISLSGTTQATVSNNYDGEGKRVKQSTSTTSRRFIYEYDKVVFELDGAASAVTARNIYGSNLLSRTIIDGLNNPSYYYMYNGHADVVALINKTDKSTAATYSYDPWGNVLSRTGSVDNNITFAGYQYDKDTEITDASGNVTVPGLYYLNARFYDSIDARFLQEDTYGGSANDPLSLNRYSYCRNEPMQYWDPTGHVSATINNQAIGNVAVYNTGVYGNLRDIQAALEGDPIQWVYRAENPTAREAIYDFWSALDGQHGTNYSLRIKFNEQYDGKYADEVVLFNKTTDYYASDDSTAKRLLGDAYFFLKSDTDGSLRVQAKISTMSYIVGSNNSLNIKYVDDWASPKPADLKQLIQPRAVEADGQIQKMALEAFRDIPRLGYGYNGNKVTHTKEEADKYIGNSILREIFPNVYFQSDDLDEVSTLPEEITYEANGLNDTYKFTYKLICFNDSLGLKRYKYVKIADNGPITNIGVIDLSGLSSKGTGVVNGQKFSSNFDKKLKKHAQDIYETSRDLNVPVKNGDKEGMKEFVSSIVNEPTNLANSKPFEWNTLKSVDTFVKGDAVVLVNRETNEIWTFLNKKGGRLSSKLNSEMDLIGK